MQEYQISNEQLRVRISSYGAEPMSIQKAGSETEYLWQGDPAYWGRRALVMFPIVGNWPDDTYIVDGKQYKMPVNGIAKLSEFNVIEQQSGRIVFELCANDTTRSAYPYDFRFLVEYFLEGSRLGVRFNVENKTNGEMPVAVGSHPGFTWPFFPGESPSDYVLQFEAKETANVFNAKGTDVLFLKNQDVLPLSHKMFEGGALYIHGLKSKWVELKSPRDSAVRLHREEFPYLILWSQANEQASYLCVEPAQSIGSKETSLYDRKGMRVLKKGESYSSKFFVEIR